MATNKEKEVLRSQIREVIFKSIANNEILGKSEEKNIKKDAYEKLVTLKGFFEKETENKKVLDEINELMIILKKLKGLIGKNL